MDNNQNENSNPQTGRGTVGKTNMDLNKTPPAATNSNATNNSCETEKEELENKNHHGAVATDSPTVKDGRENR